MVTRSLSHDEALAYAREAEDLDTLIGDIYRHRPHDRAAIGQGNARLGVVLKLADVHASLAIAEQLAALREDLNAEPTYGPRIEDDAWLLEAVPYPGSDHD